MAGIATGMEAAENTVIEGHVADAKGHSLRGAEIRVQPYDAGTEGFGVKTDGDGNFSVGIVPSGNYRVTIRVNGEDLFVANNIKTRVGDPLRITYDMKHAVVTMSSKSSKKERRFAWQESQTGSHADGRWVETYGVDGYEAPSARTERKDGRALKRIQDMSGAAGLGGQ
ncbi:MAG: Carboxypeptidase regulatory-like domain [Verrucomicrobiota bacterium]